MYTTPAAGGGQNANDLEDYLLGKKRVDKILTADDNAKVCSIVMFVVNFTDRTEYSWVHRIRTSLLSRMPTQHEMCLRRFERTLYLPSNSRSKQPMRL